MGLGRLSSIVAAVACVVGSLGAIRAGTLLPSTPWITVDKSKATGSVVLNWNPSSGSCSVLRSRDASFFGGSSVQRVGWGAETGTFGDAALADDNSYFYSVERDDAASHRPVIAEMLAHAALYGDATDYTAPAVFDQWAEIFRGRRLVRPNQNAIASVTLAQCGSGRCRVPLDTLCIADPDGSGPKAATDPNGDGAPEFSVGDVVFLGSAAPGAGSDPKHLAHAIASIRDGDAATCPAGAGNQWTLADGIDPADEPVAPGAPLTNLWLNSSHPVESGYFLLGYRLGYAARAIAGAPGEERLSVGPTVASRATRGIRTSGDDASSPAARAPEMIDRVDSRAAGAASFLIHDPGTRNIVITGDSWALPSHPLAMGLKAALAERYPGRTFNVVSTGVGGKRAGQVLSEWESLVAPHDPLYVVFVVGTNDCAGSGPATPETEFIAGVARLAMKSLSRGAIPIFAGVAPATRPDGTGFATCRALRDHQRRALLNLVP